MARRHHLHSTARREQNRKLLKSLGHESTASATAEITAHLPWLDFQIAYPRVKGKKVSIATLLLYARGKQDLEFDYPHNRESVARRQRAAERLQRLLSTTGTYAREWSICG